MDEPTALKGWGSHMANLFDVKGGKMFAVLSKLAGRMSPEIGDGIIEDPNLIDAMMEAAWKHLDKNPYEMTVSLKLAALRRANDEEKWGVTEEDFARLAATVPELPKGRLAFLSFRIRFGEGSEGVQLTFERHVARIKSVFGESGFWRWERLHSGKVEYKGKPVDRLRLLNGDHTHKAVIEWVIVDLGTHRKRDSITAVRGVKSLADELLVVAWMFPDMIRAIDYDKLPGLFAAGYEVNVPGSGEYVVVVGFCCKTRQVRVGVDDCSSERSGYSVPVLR